MAQAIHRATELIELVAHEARTPAEAAEHFDVHRSTVFRQMQTLERAGFLLRRHDGRYTIGPRLITIAHEALERIDLRRVASDELRSLQARTGNTVHLAQLIEDDIVYVDKVDDASGVRMSSRVGKTMPPYCTASGQVILSRLSPARRDAVLDRVDWVAHTERTTRDRASLERRLVTVAQRGWAVDDGEYEDFTNCIAVGVGDTSGTVVGALSLSAVRIVADVRALHRHLDDLAATARRISAELG